MTTSTTPKSKPSRSSTGTTKKAAPKAEALTLAIDIGGTGLKAALLNDNGDMVTERVRVDTPPKCPPALMIETLVKLVEPLGAYKQVSVGFPGVIRRGKVITAHNLGEENWKGFDLDLAMTKALNKPVRILNDADIQGLGAITGEGVEMVITLGTGLGSSLFEDGCLSVHLELAHHPFRKGCTYEEALGNIAYKKDKKKWNKNVQRAIDTLRHLTTFDRLYIGGGNSKNLKFELPKDVSIVSNDLGMRGGIWLWKARNASSAEVFRKADGYGYTG